MFLRDYWYVAAWGHEIGPTPLARTILEEPVVLYRRADGTVAALEDRCCHRQLPLSLGRVVGDDLQCGYHGLTFAPTGECRSVPGQTAVPPGASVKAYPVAERWGWVWIWMGAPEAADESRIEDFHWLDDPGWRAKGTRIGIDCDYRLVIDNLLDLSHLAFVHQTSFGNAAVVEAADVTTERTEAGVRVSRWMRDVPPPPMYQRIAPVEGRIDRWQIIDWTPPAFVNLDLGFAPVGNRNQAYLRRSLNAITPERGDSVHYFWADAQSFALDRPEVTDFVYGQVLDAFTEDKVVLEAQQRSRARTPEAPLVDINSDAAGLQARRILDRLLAEEARGGGCAPPCRDDGPAHAGVWCARPPGPARGGDGNMRT